ncbi:MAG TPA: hypothetical protein DCY47_00675, partial [Candidatus Accumulibacter sp.]|nr:hypothetical protein [Accumulibacter sp.]
MPRGSSGRVEQRAPGSQARRQPATTAAGATSGLATHAAASCTRAAARSRPLADRRQVKRRAAESARAGRALRASEERLQLTRFAIDRASLAIAWARADGRYLYANREMCRILGYRREELLQM